MNLGFESSAVQLAAKLTIVLGLAWLGHVALSKWNPRWQVLLWRVASLAMAILFVTSALPPLYGVPLLPAALGPGPTKPEGERVNKRSVEPAQPLEVSSAPPAESVLNTFEPVADKSRKNAESATTASEASQGLSQEFFTPQPSTPSISSEANLGPQISTGGSEWHGNWARWGLVLYLFVTGSLLVRSSIGLQLARREVTAAVPAPDWVQAIARQIAQDAQVLPIPVRITDRFESPVLCGVLRKVILLPDNLLRSSSPERDVRGAIAHEMAHAAGNDLIWDLAIAVVAAFAWPIPLVWKMRTAHRTACERVSDRMAVDALGDLESYQGLVARIALRVSRTSSDVGLAMARRSEVRHRLMALAVCPRVPRLGSPAAVIALCLTMAACLLGGGALVMPPANVVASVEEPAGANVATTPDQEAPKSEGPAAADADQKAEPNVERKKARSRPEVLQFSVIRRDNDRPVANAKITVRMYEKSPPIVADLTTDAEGKAHFKYPDGDAKVVNLYADVRCPGLVPHFARLGQNMESSALPVEQTIRLDLGKKIGGQIVDPKGNPVEGAILTINSLIHGVKTEADGMWMLDGAPLDVTGLSLRIEHPRFVGGFRQVQDRLDGRYVLDPGLTLSGRVVDESGKPVVGAMIEVGRVGWAPRPKEPRAVTSADGTFLLYALGPESTFMIAAEAAKFAPQMKKVELKGEMPPVEFVLEPGRTTRFSAVDSEGEPVPFVRIIAEKWNGFHALRWQADTDQNGLAIWDGAPNEPVEFTVFCKGFASLRDVVVSPQDEPHVFQMLVPLKIEGTVVDSQGRPIPAFRVRLGRKQPGRDEIFWASHLDVAGRNGQFQSSCNEVWGEVFLRIEAAGFRTWISDAISFHKSPQQISVRLETGIGPAGIVWAPDGQPAAGTQLMLATVEKPLLLSSGYKSIQDSAENPSVVSNQEGRFQFAPFEGAAMIVAVHESGYAEISTDKLADAGGIRLQKWGKVEASVRQGDHPSAAATVAVYPQVPTDHLVKFHRSAMTGGTNSEGRVTFERVVPGEVVVSQTILQPFDNSSWQIYDERSTRVSLAPGNPVSIQLGGTGTAVTGRFHVAGKPPARHEWSQNAALVIFPNPYDGDTSRLYRCVIAKDGSFRIDDLPSGKYELSLELTPARDPIVRNTSGVKLGEIRRQFEVTGGDPVVDLGVIEGKWTQWVKVGDKAPLFVAEGIQRDNVKLTDFQGRLLLINFWTTAPESLSQMTDLATLYDEFSNDSRFKMLGLSVEGWKSVAEAVIRQKGWPWTFAYAGQESSRMIIARYDVQTIPVCFLIDTDGTVLYRGHDVEEIRQLIGKRLEELPQTVSNNHDRFAGVMSQKIDDPFPANAPVEFTVFNGQSDEPPNDDSKNVAGLTLLSKQGKVIRNVEEIGVAKDLKSPWQTSILGLISSVRPLALDTSRARIYGCDRLHDRLVALDRFGRMQFATDIQDLHAVSVDERTGNIWCLELRGSTAGELLVLDSSGNEVARYPIRGFGISYSPVDDAFWIVGHALLKMSRDGKILSSHPLTRPERSRLSAAVAVDRERGGAWVLEQRRRDASRIQSDLWKVSPDGKATVVHHFPETTIPVRLVCVNGKPWIVVMKNDVEKSAAEAERLIQQFSVDGTASATLNLSARDVTIGLQTGAIWVQTKDTLLHVDHEGKTLQSIPNRSESLSAQLLAF